MTTAVAFVCPICRTAVTRDAGAYECGACRRRYPVLLGIPDFRTVPDAWLSIDDDRAKGVALEERTRGASFRATVEAYWAMTQTTSTDRARRFIDHVLGAETRSAEWLEAQRGAGGADALPWIDLGCGTADLAVAVARQRPVVAVDIAFRWLVAARRRIEERGLDNVTLVCADAAALPFADDVAGGVVSLGLLEHTDRMPGVIREAARVLSPARELRLRTTNRCSLLPEPHVGVWGVGFVPRRFADRYVRWRTGEGYAHVYPTSAGRLRRAMRDAGFLDVRVTAARALPSDTERLGALAGAVRLYNRLGETPVIGRAVAAVAPLLDARGVAS